MYITTDTVQRLEICFSYEGREPVQMLTLVTLATGMSQLRKMVTRAWMWHTLGMVTLATGMKMTMSQPRKKALA